MSMIVQRTNLRMMIVKKGRKQGKFMLRTCKNDERDLNETIKII